MTDIQAPTGEVADEVLNGMWPQWSESAYNDKAQAMLQLASQTQRKAQSAQRTAQYTDENMAGKAYNAILTELQLRTNEYVVHSEECARSAGWLKNMASAIQATKTAMVQAVESHQQPHADYKEAMSKAAGARGGDIVRAAAKAKHQADLVRAQSLVVDAAGTMESALDTGQAALAADSVPGPPNGTPAVPEEDQVDPRAEGHDMPAGDPTLTTSPAPTSTGASGSTPAGSGTTTGGSGGGQAPAAATPTLPTEMFAAPAAPAAPLDAAAAPAAAAAAPATDAAADAMPMSGMPMGGMPMQPQMPAGGAGQTPGNDLAKTVGDTVTKLAGKDGGGTPVSEAALSKLLDAQGDAGAAGGEGDGGHSGDKASGDDPDKLPEGVDPLKKVFGEDTGPGAGAGATAQAQGKLDPYSAANQNPGLNSPPTPSHLVAPSPAAPVITAAPSAPVSAPMTELSADENFAAPQQHPASVSDAVTTHPSAGPAAGATAPPPGAGPGANPGGGPAGGQPLGAYNPTMMGSPAPMAPMAPMGPMGAMGAMGGMMPPGGGGVGSAAPVLAAAVPAAAVAEAATSARRRAPEVPTRLSSLPPEHAAAEHHLAGLVRVYGQRGWPTAVLAIACLEGQGGVRYLLATADGVSLVPLGVPLPGGVELLSAQPLSGSFAADWSGHIHPARKLAAWANENPDAGRLVYLVSNDTSGVPAVAGAVIEVRQTQVERAGMGGGSPATLPRTALTVGPISAARADAALEAFANAWGITDATADDWRVAPGRLWAARWDRDRPADYPAILATYLYVEGLEAARQGRGADAAFSASALSVVRPYDWVAA